MASLFKSKEAVIWENGINTSNAAIYTSSSDFNPEQTPKISKIIDSLKQYNIFKYSAYRTAFKLHVIRKASKLHMIDLALVTSILKDYEFTEKGIQETITPEKAQNLICALYIEAGKKIGIVEEPNVMAVLFLAFLQNAFIENEQPLLFLHVKVTLTLFCSATLSEKFKHFYHYCSSPNGSLNRQNLHLLLKCFAKIAEIVGEQVTFGSHLVPAAVKSLLKFSKNRITLKKFQQWLLLEPQTLVWISTLHRISVSETTQHSVSCDYCQVNPLVGLRYRCLQCINYNLCQNCFLCGFVNKRHKSKHEIQEFCQPASTWDEAKAALNAIKNKLSIARCPSRAYLSFDDDTIYGSIRDKSQYPQNSIIHHSLKRNTATYIVKELTNIITELENDRRNLLDSADGSSKENIEAGRKAVTFQSAERDGTDKVHFQSFNSSLDQKLERLKELLKNIKSSNSKKEVDHISPVPHLPFNKVDHFFESTPLTSDAPKANFGKMTRCIDYSTEQQRDNNSTSLDFTNVLDSRNSLTPSVAPSTSRSTGLIKNTISHSSISYSRNTESQVSHLQTTSFNSKCPESLTSTSEPRKINKRTKESYNDDSENSEAGFPTTRYLESPCGVSNSSNGVQKRKLKNKKCKDDSENVESRFQRTGFDSKCPESPCGVSDLDDSMPSIPDLDDSKLSPLYLYPSNGLNSSLSNRIFGSRFCFSPRSPLKEVNSLSDPGVNELSNSNRQSSSKANTTGSSVVSKDANWQALELELQNVLQHIESLFPQVSGLANDSLTESKSIANSLSDLRIAAEKLSHLSLTYSTGSTEL